MFKYKESVLPILVLSFFYITATHAQTYYSSALSDCKLFKNQFYTTVDSDGLGLGANEEPYETI